MSRRTQELLARLGIILTPDQQMAFIYLEWCGKRFCVEFGTDNCVALADAQLPPWTL